MNALQLGEREFAEWIGSGRRSLGGSDVGAILGVNAYKKAEDVWDKLMGVAPPSRDNRHMRRGKEMEPVIGREYSEITGREIFRVEKQWHPRLEFLHATPDYGVNRDGGAGGILECKCHNERQFKIAKEDGVDPSYYVQLQHYLNVCGCGWGSFALFNVERWELYWFDVDRNQQLIDDMEEKLVKFWNEHVVTRQRPGGWDGLRDKLAQTIAETRAGAGTVERDDEEWADAVRELKVARDHASVAAKRKEMAEAKVKQLMGEAAAVKGGGAVVKWVESTQRKLDVRTLLRDWPDIDLSRYEVVTSVRSFTPRFM